MVSEHQPFEGFRRSSESLPILCSCFGLCCGASDKDPFWRPERGLTFGDLRAELWREAADFAHTNLSLNSRILISSTGPVRICC
jgi:hypothetical protein